MKLSLTQSQYSALTDIYGPPEEVHYMLMTSDIEGNRWILEGNEDEFDALLNVIDEEIAEGRLRFDPSILTCISCAKDTDKR